MWFTSDNAGPAHPSVIAALAEANTGYVGAYGADPITAAVQARIRDIFEAPEASVHLVATGTAANVLGLSTLAQPWETVFAHADAHLEMDECGAPEFFSGGAKLTLVPGSDGRIDPDALSGAVASVPQGFVHSVQRGPLALTQATEAGTVYTLDHLSALTEVAKAHGMPVHMDGARFANALVGLGCTPAEMTWKRGVDAVSFGGTKNGLLAAEAIVLFDPAKGWELELRRKRGAHLLSKYRYLSAQMAAYLADDLWLDLARTANARAAALAAGLAAAGAEVLYPVEANMVFARLPRAVHRDLQAAGAHYYLWPAGATLTGDDWTPLDARLVCNWSTTEAEVDTFLDLARTALNAPVFRCRRPAAPNPLAPRWPRRPPRGGSAQPYGPRPAPRSRSPGAGRPGSRDGSRLLSDASAPRAPG